MSEDVASSFLDCDKEGEEEDEVSLMRLGGWALCSCIQYREKALKGKSKTKHTPLKIEAQTAELHVLKALVMTNKDKLPMALSSQDCGFMAFPHEILLPFLRNAIITTKENVC